MAFTTEEQLLMALTAHHLYWLAAEQQTLRELQASFRFGGFVGLDDQYVIGFRMH
jgi:hypothetical protein